MSDSRPRQAAGRACPPRPSGSTLVARAARRASASAIPIDTWVPALGTKATATSRRTRWEARSRTHGAFATCTATCGSGVPTGTGRATTAARLVAIRKARPAATAVCFAAAQAGQVGQPPARLPRRLRRRGFHVRRESGGRVRDQTQVAATAPVGHAEAKTATMAGEATADDRGLECRSCGCKHFRVVYTRRGWGSCCVAILRRAVRKADPPTEACPPKPRRRWVSALREAHDNVGAAHRGLTVRVVQELLGQKDLKATMVYTHLLNGGAHGVKSPANTL